MSYSNVLQRPLTFTLTSVDNVGANFTTLYHGTITNGGSNAYAGFTFTVAGFTNSVNNGTFYCIQSTATTLLLFNFSASAETHAAKATSLQMLGLGGSAATLGTFLPTGASPRTVIGDDASAPIQFIVNGITGAVNIGTFGVWEQQGDIESPIKTALNVSPNSTPTFPFGEAIEVNVLTDPTFTGDATGCFLDAVDVNNSINSPAYFGQFYGILVELGMGLSVNGTMAYVDDFRRIYAETLNGQGAGTNSTYHSGRQIGFNCATGGFLGPQHGIVGLSWGMNFEGPRQGGGLGVWSSHQGIRMASQRQGSLLGSVVLSAASASSTNNTFTITSVDASTNGLTTYHGTGITTGAQEFITFSGFSNAVNNGTYFCIAQTATALTIMNSAAVLETASASAIITVNTYTGAFPTGGSNALAGQLFIITGFAQLGSALTLTSVADTIANNGSFMANVAGQNGVAVYTGTIGAGGDDNGYMGRFFTVAGFTTGANNGTFKCIASTRTTLTLGNASAVAQTHAATATPQVNNGIFLCTASTTTTITVNNYLGAAETHAGAAVARNGQAWAIHEDDGGDRNALGIIYIGGESGPVLQAGSGSPETLITSPVGGTYFNTSGASGTSHYVKETGTSNTGWIPLRNATINAQTGTSYAIVDGDRAKAITFSNTAAQAVTIAQAGTGGNFLSGWYTYVQNTNTGTVTITPSTSTINGFVNLVLNQNQAAKIYTDGTNYFAVFTKIASSGDATTLSAYMQNDAGVGAAANQVVVKDIGATAVNSKRKGFNVYLESNGAQAGGANFDGFQVNAGITVDANTILTGHFEAAEFFVAASGTGATVPQTNGIKVRTTVTGSATVTNVVPILMYLPTFNAGSTTSNYTGIFLDNPVGGGTVTNACAAMFQMGTGSLINTNAYGITAGGKSAAIIADDSTATGSFIGHGPVSGGSMPFTVHDGWYGFTGSPEGSLSAKVGSMYSRQDSTIGDAFYVKGTGTGNTGWAPCSTLSPIVTKTTTYSATNADGTILGNGTFTITLPNTLLPTGKTLRIKNIGTGVITVSSAVNIDGATSFTLPTQYQSSDVQWDGTQWWIL